MIKDLIKNNIKKMNYGLRDNWHYWKTSAGNMILFKELGALLPKYCKGKVLDAGAGNLLYKKVLTKYTADYESMDFERTHPGLTYVADIQNMLEINSGRYDFVFSRNVLEHVPNPTKAVSEISRVLKDGGYAVITVPYLGYLHNEPHDYWRFTKYSLKKIIEENRLEVVEIKELGGLLAFKGYIFQTIFLGLTYNIPGINKLTFWINFVIQRCLLTLDKFFGMKKIFPLSYLIVVRKTTI
ncbi:MAG TPA: class I SAM-dependent methyltransferase [Candidatus Paceibacterota bacterium]|nr:class I SAM-dependent methyltransferase [Candidatus Paceibacterota bacterium]HRZ34655.1 class I SAM-dependent methyltransferase [Candidatus Paceibacterota bacterium]